MLSLVSILKRYKQDFKDIAFLGLIISVVNIEWVGFKVSTIIFILFSLDSNVWPDSYGFKLLFGLFSFFMLCLPER